ncbi:hypothetical protein EHQ52_05170 [Leptospira koniambonensis]|uniref:SMI1/KNR4 family protein n=1 Tax=Leptospira koniambonensis TaxID=2484950 RepID=A0A4R9J5K6_9LEPT|nr:hypothetical protein [Leptospira koniambonensis]TGL33923.1 hypothetical protein EHQ52_05170 [Leptospira koniambonensis]
MEAIWGKMMTSEPYEKLEQVIGYDFPKEYLDVVARNPFKDSKDPRFKTDLLTSWNDIATINLKVRKEGYNSQEWPSHFFIIGYAGDIDEPDYFFINLKSKRTIIFKTEWGKIINPKNVTKLVFGDNFDSWISTMISIRKVTLKAYLDKSLNIM